MQNLEPSDLWSLSEYERRRDDFRHRIMELKKRRRVQIGALLSLVFENRDTVLYQVQEMLRAERVSDPERVREELEIYNTMLPGPGELSATLFIEVTDPERLPQELAMLHGLDQVIYLEIGRERVQGTFEEGRSKREALSTVQYVKFRPTPAQAEALRAGRDQAVLASYHAKYQERSILSPETRQELARDLEG